MGTGVKSLAELNAEDNPLMVKTSVHEHIPDVGDLYVQVPINIYAYFEEKRKELDTLGARANGLLKKLDNEAFKTKAPPEIVEKVEASWLEVEKHRNSVLMDMLDKIDDLREMGVKIR